MPTTAAIDEVNIVRKHLSQVKGGRIAALCGRASLLTLVVSDVVGDDLSVIASGPTVPDLSTYSDAISIINKYDLKYLDKDIANFEPKLALYGGLDGLSEIRKVVKKSSELIKKNGKLILEIGFDQKNKVKNLLKNKGFYINKVVKDLAKNDRCIVCTKI